MCCKQRTARPQTLLCDVSSGTPLGCRTTASIVKQPRVEFSSKRQVACGAAYDLVEDVCLYYLPIQLALRPSNGPPPKSILAAGLEGAPKAFDATTLLRDRAFVTLQRQRRRNCPVVERPPTHFGKHVQIKEMHRSQHDEDQA